MFLSKKGFSCLIFMIKKVNEQDQQLGSSFSKDAGKLDWFFSSSKSCLYPDLTALTLKFLWMLDN